MKSTVTRIILFFTAFAVLSGIVLFVLARFGAVADRYSAGEYVLQENEEFVASEKHEVVDKCVDTRNEQHVILRSTVGNLYDVKDKELYCSVSTGDLVTVTTVKKTKLPASEWAGMSVLSVSISFIAVLGITALASTGKNSSTMC